ncbi:hypothetical protein [Atribacter sp.]|jgi:hypothetical protein|uniref:hypothetical protein n=1 Tax=Atribacter sp. TaxID=2847780 RepID=UPI00345E8040
MAPDKDENAYLNPSLRGVQPFFWLNDVAISAIQFVVLRSPVFLLDDLRISSFKVFIKNKKT